MVINPYILEAIMIDKEISGNDLRVFLYLAVKIKSKYQVNYVHKDIGIDLTIPRSNVSRSIKNLRNRGYIDQFKSGRKKAYALAVFEKSVL